MGVLGSRHALSRRNRMFAGAASAPVEELGSSGRLTATNSTLTLE